MPASSSGCLPWPCGCTASKGYPAVPVGQCSLLPSPSRRLATTGKPAAVGGGRLPTSQQLLYRCATLTGLPSVKAWQRGCPSDVWLEGCIQGGLGGRGKERDHLLSWEGVMYACGALPLRHSPEPWCLKWTGGCTPAQLHGRGRRTACREVEQALSAAALTATPRPATAASWRQTQGCRRGTLCFERIKAGFRAQGVGRGSGKGRPQPGCFWGCVECSPGGSLLAERSCKR